MSKMKKTFMLLMALALMIIIAGCGTKVTDESSATKTDLAKTEIKSEAFKDLFPLQYNSYQKTLQEDTISKYGGSKKISKFDHTKEPYLPILFNGYGFATDYNEDRGHLYANEDIRAIKRITDKSVGSCLTCKSTAVPQMIEEMGDNYWGGNFNKDVWPKAESMKHSPIGCSDCHDPETMDLRITRPNLVKALATRGIDVAKATKNDMRTYVCAQCHVEYYFAKSNSEVTFPWAKGVSPDQMYEYYSTVAKDSGFEKDWVHNVSGTPMLKAQHPEYETFIEGPHGKAGVSCADCHMPYTRTDDGKKKYTSHYITSPLKTMDTSCGTCHASDLDKRKETVLATQDKHIAALHEAENLSVKSHYYVNKMITSKAPEAQIKAAQQNIRKAQWLWDIIAAENGAGFHNPQGAMDALRESMDESHKAIEIATKELTKLNVNFTELDGKIEAAMKAVYNEPDTFIKKTHAINEYFPAQQPPPPATPAVTPVAPAKK